MTEPNAEAATEAAELASLGEFVGDDAPPAAPAAPEKPAAEEPAKEPEKAPEPEPAPEATDDDEDDDSFTVEELDERIQTNMRKAIEQARKEAAEAEAAGDDERTPAEKALAEENARLKAEADAAKQALAERDESEAVAKIQHAIESAAGKYKMTAAEIDAVTADMLDNPNRTKSGVGFEAAALRLFPNLSDRLKTAPAATAPPAGQGADGVLVAPTASGAGAPQPFKHKPERGEYGDITRHVMASGEAAALGKYE